MDSQETLPENNSPIWPELSADVTVARSVARAITLDTQKASMDGRVIELSSQVQAVNLRLLEIEKVVGNQSSKGNDNVDDLSNLVTSLRSEIDRTNAKFDDLAQNAFTVGSPPEVQPATAPEPDERVPELAERIGSVEEARFRDSEQLASLMSYLEQAFNRLDTISDTVDRLAAPDEKPDELEPVKAELGEVASSLQVLRSNVSATDETLRSEVARIEERLVAQVTDVASQVSDVETGLRQQVERAESNLADQVAHATEQLNARSTSADGDITRRLSEAESTVADARASLAEARSQLDETREELGTKFNQFDQFDSRFEQFGARFDQFGARIEQFGSRFDESELLLQGKLAAATGDMADRVAAAEDNLATQVIEAARILTEHESNTEENLAAQVAEARSALTQQVGDAVSELEAKLAQLELPRDEGRIDELTATLAALTGALEAIQNQHVADSQRISALQLEVGRVLEAETGPSASQVDEIVDAKFSAFGMRIESATDSIATTNDKIDTALIELRREVEATLAQRTSAMTAEDVAAIVDAHLAVFAERIGDAENRVAGVVSRFESIDDRFDQGNDRVATVSDQVATVADQVTTVTDRVGSVTEQVTTVTDQVGSLTEQVTTVTDQVATASDQIATVADQVTTVTDQVGSLTEQVATARDQVATVSDQVTTVTDHVGAMGSQVAGIGERVAGVDGRVNEIDGHVNEIRGDLESSKQSLAGVTEQLSQIDHQVSDLAADRSSSEQIDILGRRVDEAHELIGYIQSDESVDETIATINARVDEALTASDSLSGAVSEEVTNQLGDIGQRVDNIHARVDDALDTDAVGQRIEGSIEGHLFDINQRVDNAHRRIDETVAAPLAALQERVDDTSGVAHEARDIAGSAKHAATETLAQLDESKVQIDEASAQLANHGERLHHIEIQLTDLAESAPADDAIRSEHIAELEASLNERAHAATQAIRDQAAATEQLLAEQVGQVEANLVEQVIESRELLSTQVIDAEALIDQRLDRAEGDLDARLSASEASLADEFARNESDLNDRLATAELALSERIEATRASFASQIEQTAAVQAPAIDPVEFDAIRGDIELAHNLAIEAQQFTEHLRLLQTDLVKAVQAELTQQSTRLASLTSTVENSDARVEYLESTIGAVLSMPQGELGLAPSPDSSARITKLERHITDLDLSSVNAIDERTSALDSHVSSSIAALTEALELNNSEVSALRLELERAQTRIADLERGVGSTSQGPVAGLTVEDVLGTGKVSQMSDDDWFTGNVSRNRMDDETGAISKDQPQTSGSPSRKRSKRGKNRK